MSSSAQIPDSKHLTQRWRVHAIAQDFRLLDVWRFALNAKREDFPSFSRMMADTQGLSAASSAPTRALFGLRLWMGKAFGWDRARAPLPIPGCAETTLRARLAGSPATEAERGGAELQVVYEDELEALLELSNSTCHALLHLGWVEVDGAYCGQMAVYVKPRGRAGSAYMKLIEPFRHWVVYPSLTSAVARRWAALEGERRPGGATVSAALGS